jgi:hypothetical protein
MKKNNKTYRHEQIRLEVNVINDKPILNVFMEDGAWFAVSSDMRITEGSQCHPGYYEKVWGKPMPVSSTKYTKKRS